VKPLFISDLDGTLLRDDTSLSEHSRQELVSLLGEGVQITVASARSVPSMRALLGGIPFRLPVIEANGSFISDYATGRHEHVASIPPRAARDAFRLVRERGMTAFIPAWNGERDLVYYECAANDGMRAYVEERRVYRDERLRRTADLASALADPGSRVISFTVIDRLESLLGLAAELRGELPGLLTDIIYEYRSFPGWYFLTLHDRTASKDQAITVLRERWDLSGSELVVFGDEANDEGMFRLADRAVAPSNARESIKALAHEVIGSNEEDAVVRYIRGRVGGGTGE
jgi:5-amino-6-(5-phospho-D-ribitylamino)uracil phosphatase